MADTPPVGETQTPPLNNNVTPPAPVTPPVTPPTGNVDAAAEANKRAEQAEMRANQLANELKAKTDAEAAAKSKQLEEQQEYKTLYEQQKAEAERLASEREADTKKQTLTAEQTKITAEYAPEVIEIAKDLGYSLNDTSEDAIKAFKATLDKVQEKVGGKTPVTPNNNQNQRPVDASRAETIAQYRKTGDPALMDKAVSELSFVKPYTQQQ